MMKMSLSDIDVSIEYDVDNKPYYAAVWKGGESSANNVYGYGDTPLQAINEVLLKVLK